MTHLTGKQERREAAAREIRRRERLATLARKRDVLSQRRVEFTVFDADTGRILRTGFCQAMDVARQPQGPNEIVVEGTYPDDKHIIEFGEDGWRVVDWTPPVLISPARVKAECQRRIFDVYPMGKQLTLMDRKGDELDAMRAYRDAVLAACDRLEAMTPIPTDYTNDKHWPARP